MNKESFVRKVDDLEYADQNIIINIYNIHTYMPNHTNETMISFY